MERCEHPRFADIYAPEDIETKKDERTGAEHYSVKPNAKPIMKECQHCGQQFEVPKA